MIFVIVFEMKSVENWEKLSARLKNQNKHKLVLHKWGEIRSLILQIKSNTIDLRKKDYFHSIFLL